MSNEQDLNFISDLLSQETRDASYCLYPHINADGDALGSCLGLAMYLDKLGRKAYIFAEEVISPKLARLPQWEKYIIHDFDRMQNIVNEDTCFAIMLDCSVGSRIGKREVFFDQARYAWIVDHHIPDDSYTPKVPVLVDSKAAAACEIVSRVLRKIDEDLPQSIMDVDIAEALLTGIITDTGCFAYSNTRQETFEEAAWLMNFPVPISKIHYELFHLTTRSKFRLRGFVSDHTQFLFNNQFAICSITAEQMHALGITQPDLEGIAGEIRCVEGVEVAILLREEDTGEIKGSLRSNENFNAQALARTLGGGGHMRASGVTVLDQSLKEVETFLINQAGQMLGATLD